MCAVGVVRWCCVQLGVCWFDGQASFSGIQDTGHMGCADTPQHTSQHLPRSSYKSPFTIALSPHLPRPCMKQWRTTG